MKSSNIKPRFLMLISLSWFANFFAIYADERETASVKEAVLVVIGGNFSSDSLGPEKYEAVKKLVSEKAITSNQILASDILVHDRYNAQRLSSLYIDSLLRLTLRNDRAGALKAAKLYRAALDDGLKDFDGAANKDAFLTGKPENDRMQIQRLIQRRDQVNALIGTR